MGFFGYLISIIIVITGLQFTSEYMKNKAFEKALEQNVISIPKKTPPIAQTQLQPSEKKVIAFQLKDNKKVYIEEEKLKSLNSTINSKLNEIRINSITQVNSNIDQGVDEIFRICSDKIPRYADWYYTVPSEIMRVKESISGDIVKYTTERMKEHIFTPAGLNNRMDVLKENLDKYSFDKITSTKNDIQILLADFLNQNKVSDKDKIIVTSSLNIKNAVDNSFKIPNNQISQKTAVIRVGGVTAGAFALTTLASKATFKVMIKSVAKMAGKEYLALPFEAACAGTGPAALVCAVGVAGIAEELLLKAEEKIYREDLERDLGQTLIEQSNEIKTSFKNIYGTALIDSYNQIGTQLLKQAQETTLQPINGVSIKDF